MDEAQQGDMNESELNEHLWGAVLEGDLDDVKACILDGADISAKDKTGSTAVHQAVRNNRINIVKFLLDIETNLTSTTDEGLASQSERKVQKPEVNTTDKTGETPLLRAVINNQTDVVELLLEHGAQTGSFDYQGDSELSVAIWNKNNKIATRLIPETDDINTRNKDGITAFLWAASTGNTALGLMLAQRGVDTSEATEGKGTALHFAASGGHLEFLDFLLNPEALSQPGPALHTSRLTPTSQAPAESQELPQWSVPDLEARQINGLTPLLFAAWEGQRDTVALLLKHGSKITAIDDDGWTALHLSVYNEHIEVVKLLLEAMNGDMIAVGNKDGDTALHVACQGEDERIIKQLLKIMETKCRYAIVHKNRAQLTALSVAVEAKAKGFVQLLVNYEADVLYLEMPAEEDWPWPAMVDGIDPQQVELTGEILLELANAGLADDSDPNVQIIDSEGRLKSLAWAARNGDEEILSQLLRLNDIGPSRVLYWAAVGGQEDIVESLLQKYNETPPDALVADEVGPKAIEAAARNGHEEIVSLLIQKLIEIDKETFLLKSPAKSTDKWTPLHWAVNYKPEEAVLIVRHMLMNGANPDAPLDNVDEPFSAVDLARSLKGFPGFDQDILRLLVTPYRLPKKPIQLEEPVHPENLVADICDKFYTNIIDFYPSDGHFNTLERKSTIQEIIYEKGPDELMANARRTWEISDKLEHRFRWIHLPENNWIWAEDLMQRIAYESKKSVEDYTRLKNFVEQTRREHPGKIHSRFMYPALNFESKDFHSGEDANISKLRSENKLDSQEKRKRTTGIIGVSKDIPTGAPGPGTHLKVDAGKEGKRRGLGHKDSHQHTHEDTRRKSIAPGTTNEMDGNLNNSDLGGQQGGTNDVQELKETKSKRSAGKDKSQSPTDALLGSKMGISLPFLTFQSVKTQRKLRQAVRLAEEIQSKQPESLVEDTGLLEERAAAETRRLQMARSDAGGTILAKEISAGFEILQSNTKEHERFDDVVSYHEVGNPGGVQQIDISRTIGPLKEYLTTSLDRFLGGNSGSNETNKNYNSPDILEWLEKLEDALAIYEQTQQPSSKYEALLEHYLRPEQAKGLHTSRTIDQFYYSSLSDTCRRDMDQVVRRYQARKFEESRHDNFQMGMVEQLWLWVIDDKTIITCFPKSFGGGIKNGRGRELLEQIRTHIHEDTRPQISSIYHLATIITSHCVRFVEECQARIPGGNESFLQMFSSSIGTAADKEVEYFETFQREIYEARRDKKSKADGDKSKSSVHELDLGKEIKLLEEVKDIRDELNILKSIFEDQSSLLQKLFGLIAGYSPPGGRKGGDQDPIVSFYRQRSDIDLRIERAEKMQRDINAIYDSINHLLDLKQKNANVFEAVQARLEAEETTAQGRTIMVFTIVTIIFLPMSFLTSLYALQVDSFPHDGGDFIYPSKWIWSRIFGTSGAIAIPLCVVAIYINTILDFYEKSVRLRIKKWIGGKKKPDRHVEQVKLVYAKPSVLRTKSGLATGESRQEKVEVGESKGEKRVVDGITRRATAALSVESQAERGELNGRGGTRGSK